MAYACPLRYSCTKSPSLQGLLLSLWFPPCVAIVVANYLLGHHVVSNGLQKCIVVVGIAISFFFYPGHALELLVTERMQGLRDLLSVMGMAPWVYWTGHLVADMLVYVLQAKELLIFIIAFFIVLSKY